MLMPGVKKIATALELSVTPSMALGVVGNTLVRLYDGRNMKVLEMTLPQVDQEVKAHVAGLLGTRKLKKSEWKDARLIVRFPEYLKPYPAAAIQDFITTLAAWSQSRFPEDHVVCEECRTASDITPYGFGEGSVFLCPGCTEHQLRSLAAQKDELAAAPANRLIGALAAFLLAVPGILVTAVLFVFLERIAALSSVIYVFLATKGYTLAKGKLDKAGVAIITTAGLVLTVLGMPVSYYAMILYQTSSLALTATVMAMPEVINEMMLNTGIALVVSLFYLVVTTYEMVKKWKVPELKAAQALK